LFVEEEGSNEQIHMVEPTVEKGIVAFASLCSECYEKLIEKEKKEEVKKNGRTKQRKSKVWF